MPCYNDIKDSKKRGAILKDPLCIVYKGLVSIFVLSAFFQRDVTFCQNTTRTLLYTGKMLNSFTYCFMHCSSVPYFKIFMHQSAMC